jgi:hypothetical protein
MKRGCILLEELQHTAKVDRKETETLGFAL